MSHKLTNIFLYELVNCLYDLKLKKTTNKHGKVTYHGMLTPFKTTINLMLITDVGISAEQLRVLV